MTIMTPQLLSEFIIFSFFFERDIRLHSSDSGAAEESNAEQSLPQDKIALEVAFRR